MEQLHQEQPQEELDAAEFDKLAEELLSALDGTMVPESRKNFLSVALMRQRLIGQVKGQKDIMDNFDKLLNEKMREILEKRTTG